MSTPKEIMLEKVPCPIGCGESDEVVMTGHDLLHDLPGEFTVVKCRSCGLMRTSPRPAPDSIGFYYPDNYGPYVGTRVKDTPKSTSVIKKIFRPLFRRVFNFNVTPLPNMVPGRLLEIGCASGAFLHRMSGQGWQVQGIEFSEKAAQAAAQLGYRVHAGPLETAPQPDAPFDLIVGWMVLEHLHDPVAGLQMLREWAKPGAWLVLSVPNAGSLEFRIFREKWYALQLPTHLHHFTPGTIEKVLSIGGWQLQKIKHQRVLSNVIVSTGYFLRDKGYKEVGDYLISLPRKSGKLDYLLYPFSWVLSLFGQTGRMTIWAKIK